MLYTLELCYYVGRSWMLNFKDWLLYSQWKEFNINDHYIDVVLMTFYNLLLVLIELFVIFFLFSFLGVLNL